ncbi:hypothetical protein KVT40_003128 [Elsinoe batatas]|uniref:Uncharacterized protein n=1 Tax=Elsinoe batatas TaxID=2601811 RepID=A0A8K0PJ81_9PEZI|nr:hypothetical protein KVT40_003128 [Elsinoe batatas]
MPGSEGSSRSPSPHGEGSHNGDHHSSNQPKAPKDKECPFCHQPFTSSSLGRHLDLYIKPKNPKPPDGIHNLARIRELRGKITRRQPRNSLKKQDTDESREGHGQETSQEPQSAVEPLRPIQTHIPPLLAAKRSSLAERETDMLSPAGNFTGNPDRSRPEERVRTAFGTSNWQGTGVITGLPSFSADMNRFQHHYKNVYNSSLNPPRANGRPQSPATVEGDETGKAAQLALREVLDSIDAARSQAAPLSLFDFDYFGHSFSSLCLKLLPSPRTLFSLNPFSTPETWSLHPPTEQQHQAVRDTITARAATAGYDLSSPEVLRALRHLDTSYAHWSSIPDSEKHQTWHLEVLRAYSQAQKKSVERCAELKLARQQAEFFRQQYERLVRSLDPKDAYLLSAQPLPVGTETLRDLEADPEKRAWDYDRLIGKWRGRLRGDPTVEADTPRTTTDANGDTDSVRERRDPRDRGSGQGMSPATYGPSPTMAPPLRMDREQPVRFFWETPKLMGNRGDCSESSTAGAGAGSTPTGTGSGARGTPTMREIQQGLPQSVPNRDRNRDRDADREKERDRERDRHHDRTRDLDRDRDSHIHNSQPHSRERDRDEVETISRPASRAIEGDKDWLDAASQAVVRVMKERNVPPEGKEREGEDKEVNGNGKRVRPRSWGDKRPAPAGKEIWG